MHVPLSDLPESARLWVYASAAPFTPEQEHALRERLPPFLATWATHGRPVRGALDLLDGRFLILAADVPDGDISGCGIDASVHAIEALGASLGIDWLSGLEVLYRDADGQVRSVDRPEFRRLVREGKVDGETLVFDISLDALSSLRNGALERPAADSWHARVFRIPETA